MKFKKIRIKNIRSYENQEIEFPDGSLLLSGEIGSGKTSILLAIEYALFGLQPGQKGSSLLRTTSDLGEVDLEIEIEGRPILIERKLKRSQKGVTNDYAAITIEGEKIETSITELKSKIVSLLGYPQEFIKKNNTLYRYTVYTPQEQMKQIIQEDPESRLNILRHVFGIDKYKKIRENIAILLTNLKNNSKLLQGEISSLNEDKENIKLRKSNLQIINQKITISATEIQTKTTQRKNIEQELNELTKKIEQRQTFEREVEKTQIHLSTKRQNIASITREIQELKSHISDTEPFNQETYLSITNQITQKIQEVENLNTNFINTTSSINSLEKEKLELLERKQRIFKIDLCPTCLQDVPEAHKHNILNEVESKLSKIENNLNQLQEQRNQLNTQTQIQKQSLSELQEQKTKLEILKSKLEYLEKSKQKIQELEKQISSLENDLTFLTKHFTTLKENILKYSVFQNQFNLKQSELQKAFTEEKNAEITLAELKRELQISHQEILFLEQAIEKKEISKKKLLQLQETTDWLSTQFLNLIEFIERTVLIKLRQEFSNLFRTWFLMLIPENTLDSQIDENFTPIIMQGEIEMDYEFLSGGERTAVALAYRLALNQIVNSILSKIKTHNLIILDEPTDGFSEAQISKMRDIFEELNTEQLIIVSHEQKIESFVDNVLKITKQGNNSTISPPTP